MRLFVQHANRTVVVALSEGATLTDLLDKCTTKFGLTSPITLELDVEGAPVIDHIEEVRDGDRMRLTVQTTPTLDVTTEKDSEEVILTEEGDSEVEFTDEEDSEDFEVTEEEDSDDPESSEEGGDSEDSGEGGDSDYEGDSPGDDESEDDYVERKPKKAKMTHSPSSAPTVSMQAVMDKNVVMPASTTAPSVDDEIRERIRNILQLGLHPNTPEAEAANSMRLAERMLRKHNVSRAEVMETAEDASVNGDIVKVHIRNPQTNKPSTTKHWFHDLARAMTHHFKCKYYFNVNRKWKFCFFAFYGIASNVYAAAFAFETTFNRIMTLMSRHMIPSGEYDRKRRTGEISVCRATYTKMARVSYCDGVAMGLLERVREMTAKPPPTTVSEEIEYDVTPEEETRLACLTQKVEEGVLEKNNISFKGKGHTYTRVQRRSESYAAGKRDSSHIDLQQRTLA